MEIKSAPGVVVLDFGLARDEASPDDYQTFRPVGAMSHCAPEKWLKPSKAGKASDIFSVGVMLYRLLTGENPFWADTYIALYEQIKTGKYKPLPSYTSAVAKIYHYHTDRSFPTRRMEIVMEIMDLVIKKMLDPRQDQRIPDATAALDLLGHIEATLNLWWRSPQMIHG
jgi:serine/threonine protein kinase